MPFVKPFTKGDNKRTARKAAVMQELANAANSLYGMTVSPANVGSFVFIEGGAGGVLNLNPLAQKVKDAGDGTYPFKPANKSGQLSIRYGEVNGVGITGISDGETIELTVTGDGVYYVAVNLDETTREVVSCDFGQAPTESEVPDDSEFIVQFILGTFSVVSGVVYPRAIVRTDIEFWEGLTVRNGALVRRYFRTFERADGVPVTT